MSDGQTPAVGTIVWQDLTVPDAEGIRDFYSAVIGWKMKPLSVGDYNDFTVHPQDEADDPIAGICHALGENSDVPPQWLMYVYVEDVAASAARCVAQGGKIVAGPRKMGDSDFCVIQDPAGAVLGLIR